MNICSICLKCFDDSNAICDVEGHGSLTRARNGSCLIVEGYRIDSLFESASPVELFKATHLASKKSVLISFVARDAPLSKLESELRTVIGMSHPNLTRVFEFGKIDKNELFIVQEVPFGRSLHDELSERAHFDEKQAIEIARQVAEALDDLHSRGLIHGAISPSNIFISTSETGDRSVKLCNYDFGGMARKGDSAKAGIDSIRYYSPEHFEDGDIDFRSDIYSLAAVFYHLLLGRPTMDKPSAESISDFVFDQSDVWDLHIDLRALIAHTLRQSFQRRLELRPRTTGNLVGQLRQLEFIANRLNADSSSSRDRQKAFERPSEAEAPERGVAPAVPELGKPSVSPVDLSRSDQPSRTDDVHSVYSTLYEISEIDVDYDVDDLQVIDRAHVESPGPVSRSNETLETESHGIVEGPLMRTPVYRQQAGARRNYFDGRVSSTFLFAAGLLFAAVFGGAVTATVLEWQRDGEPPKAVNQEKISSESKPDPVIDRSAEIADSDKMGPEDPQDSDASYQERRELDQVVTLVSAEEPPGELAATRRPGSKMGAATKTKRPDKRKPIKSKKGPKRDENGDGTKRPELFKTVVIYY